MVENNKNIPEIPFDPFGETLYIDVVMESAQVCTYEFTSHDVKGFFQGAIIKGNNISGSRARFHMPVNVENLDHQIIGWHIILAEPAELKDAPFEVTIHFKQEGFAIQQPPLTISGTHSSEKVIIGFARFTGKPVRALKSAQHPLRPSAQT